MQGSPTVRKIADSCSDGPPLFWPRSCPWYRAARGIRRVNANSVRTGAAARRIGPVHVPDRDCHRATNGWRTIVMRRLSAGLIAAALLLSLAPSVRAQTKTLPGEKTTITATVEAVEASTRTITLKGPKGNYVDIVAPDSVKRFSEIKVGDTITATYYDNVVLRVKHPGEKSVDTDKTAVTPGPARSPARPPPHSGRSRRRLPRSIPPSPRLPSRAPTIGPTAHGSRTGKRSRPSRSATRWTSPGPQRCWSRSRKPRSRRSCTREFHCHAGRRPGNLRTADRLGPAAPQRRLSDIHCRF